MIPLGGFTPADIPLPAFVDPFLEYIRSVIPPPLYYILLNSLSHALALLSSLSAAIFSLLSTKPWEWGVQTVLPPLISLLAAYLALVSLYRTTTWMIRASVWFLKWGIIIGALIAGIACLVGTPRPKSPRAKSSPRPKPWESFERHQKWEAGDKDNDIQKIIADIAGAAGRAVRESGWWEMAKSVVDGSGDLNAHSMKKSTRQGKTTVTKGKSSRSR